jgi:hypothetical protein
MATLLTEKGCSLRIFVQVPLVVDQVCPAGWITARIFRLNHRSSRGAALRRLFMTRVGPVVILWRSLFFHAALYSRVRACRMVHV